MVVNGDSLPPEFCRVVGLVGHRTSGDRVQILVNSLDPNLFRVRKLRNGFVNCISPYDGGVLQIRLGQSQVHVLLFGYVTPMVDVLFECFFDVWEMT